MRSDFEQGAYNVHEHNHVEWTDEQLQNRLSMLYENNRAVGYTGDRLAQVTREMGLIAFEMAERYREQRNQEIDEAWAGREDVQRRINDGKA